MYVGGGGGSQVVCIYYCTQIFNSKVINTEYTGGGRF
jgi:hypothetical protein